MVRLIARLMVSASGIVALNAFFSLLVLSQCAVDVCLHRGMLPPNEVIPTGLAERDNLFSQGSYVFSNGLCISFVHARQR